MYETNHIWAENHSQIAICLIHMNLSYLYAYNLRFFINPDTELIRQEIYLVLKILE